jgi:anti-anti-sigma factor
MPTPAARRADDHRNPEPEATMALKVTTTLKKPGVFVVSPVGSIDTTSYSILDEKVGAVLAQQPDLVIFDLESTDYINSMGIRVLVKTKKALQARNAKLVFINLQPPIRKVFDILNALPSLQVFASVAELDAYLDAMQAAAGGAPKVRA